MKRLKIVVVRTDKKSVNAPSETVLLFDLSKGLSYIAEIIGNPNVLIPNQLLAGERSSLRELPEEFLVFDSDSGNTQIMNRFNLGYGENGVELIDRETINQCRKRINALNTRLAVLTSEGMLTPKIKEEIEAEKNVIIAYLKKNYNFRQNRFRFSKTGSDRFFQALSMAVRRAIALIETEDKAVAALLRAVIRVNPTHSLYIPEEGITIEVTFIE
jgi:hypothetical protein